MDHRPWIEVEFRDNHVITAIEIRGIVYVPVVCNSLVYPQPPLWNAWNASLGLVECMECFVVTCGML